MKIRVTLKDPDGFYQCVNDAVKEELKKLDGIDDRERDVLADARVQTVWKKLERWIEYQEYVDIEFDTDAGTAIVVERKS